MIIELDPPPLLLLLAQLPVEILLMELFMMQLLMAADAEDDEVAPTPGMLVADALLLLPLLGMRMDCDGGEED